MAYESTGLQALFPVYLARMAGENARREEYDISVAQNEANLNQNLSILYGKLSEVEAYLSGQETAGQTPDAGAGEATE